MGDGTPLVGIVDFDEQLNNISHLAAESTGALWQVSLPHTRTFCSCVIFCSEKPGAKEWLALEKQKVPLLLNFSQCKLYEKDYYKVIEHCSTVLKSEPGESTLFVYTHKYLCQLSSQLHAVPWSNCRFPFFSVAKLFRFHLLSFLISSYSAVYVLLTPKDIPAIPVKAAFVLSLQAM
jgi:hypothetical protein